MKDIPGQFELGVSNEQQQPAEASDYVKRSRVDLTGAVASLGLTRSATRQCPLLDCCMLYVPSFDPSKYNDAISIHLLCRRCRLDHHNVHRRAAQVKLIETSWER